ncbi:unnamed protein product [Rangifer tarandus platyrhynchus]|uniref:Uncharacterized protein n=1 Tax=Rangifer tarandus platyrhynchus TaxID=3082113 RepID=A0AC59YF54_RANTA
MALLPRVQPGARGEQLGRLGPAGGFCWHAEHGASISMALFAYLNPALRFEATETHLTRGGRTAEESQGGGGEDAVCPHCFLQDLPLEKGSEGCRGPLHVARASSPPRAATGLGSPRPAPRGQSLGTALLTLMALVSRLWVPLVTSGSSLCSTCFSPQDVLVRNVVTLLKTNWENSGGAKRREETELGRRTSNRAKYEPSKALKFEGQESGVDDHLDATFDLTLEVWVPCGHVLRAPTSWTGSTCRVCAQVCTSELMGPGIRIQAAGRLLGQPLLGGRACGNLCTTPHSEVHSLSSGQSFQAVG